MKTLFVKTSENTLQIVGENNLKRFEKIGVGEMLEGDYKQPRSPKFHRLFFALLNVMFDNQDEQTDFKVFRKLLMYKIGEVNIIGFVNGVAVCEPKSISFAEMDEPQFQEVYEKTLNIALESHFKGYDKNDVEELLHSFL